MDEAYIAHQNLPKPIGYFDTVTGTIFYLWWPTHTIPIGVLRPDDPTLLQAKAVVDGIQRDLGAIEEERLVKLAMKVIGGLDNGR